ncbi:MAG TPA: flagellar basal body P-ring formation protein FlgA [Acidiferrobacteraceae bacterium]|nr:flagellar basal body P-ring formation protein FlgA [Acidiferrobacteraceae bacterium]
MVKLLSDVPQLDRIWIVLLGLVVLPGALFSATSAATPAFEDHRQIRAVAEDLARQHSQYPASKVQVKAANLDPRLRMARCDTALEAFLPHRWQVHGRGTVGVRCTGQRPWTLYVSVNVSIYDQVVVSAHPLPRGARLSQADLKLEKHDLARLVGGYLQDPQQVIGKVLRRPIGLGSVFTPAIIESERLIHRGDRVQIVASLRGMEVRMIGKALNDGAAGDRVQVRNLSTKRIIEGTVTHQGFVRVQL